MKDVRLSCAFTGHRPKKLPWRYDEEDERCVQLKAVLAEQIRQLAERGFTDFLSGMAEGTDLWAARAVLNLREDRPELKLHCILPHRGQADGWGAAARAEHRAILEEADSIVYLRRAYRNGCMLERNRFLVDHAALLLAVYNGEPRGGTAATVRYARKAGRGMILIDPVSGKVSVEGE